jgi:hypothetical protein
VAVTKVRAGARAGCRAARRGPQPDSGWIARFPPKTQLRGPLECTRIDGAVVCHYASLALHVHDSDAAEALTVCVGDFVEMCLSVRYCRCPLPHTHTLGHACVVPTHALLMLAHVASRL